jgi:hypothetical protein
MSFPEYARILMEFFTDESWAGRVHGYAEGIQLPRYQAACSRSDAQTMYDAMLLPFNEQRSCYRQHYKTKNAPNIFFYVKPRVVRQRDSDNRVIYNSLSEVPDGVRKIRGIRLSPGYHPGDHPATWYLAETAGGKGGKSHGKGKGIPDPPDQIDPGFGSPEIPLPTLLPTL